MRVMLQGHTFDPVEDISDGFSRSIKLPEEVSKEIMFSITNRL